MVLEIIELTANFFYHNLIFLLPFLGLGVILTYTDSLTSKDVDDDKEDE